MGALRSVPALLARTDRSFAKTQHRLRPVKFWLLGIFGCLYVGFLVFSVVAFVAVWREGNWLSYWAAFVGVGPLGIGIARIALWRDARADLFTPVAELRQAIRDGNGTLASVAEASREPASAVSADPRRLGPLRRPAAMGAVATLWGIAVLVLLVACIGVPIAFSGGNGYLAPLFATVGAIVGLLPGLGFILLGWRLISPLYVRIDPEGLRWRRPLGPTAFAAWRDATRFFSLTDTSPFAHNRETLYVLDGGTVTLAWRAGAVTRSDASLPSPSLQLRQLITAYTGLPLRDVTAQATHIASGAEAGTPPTDSRGASTGVRASHPSREEVRHRLRVAGGVLSPSLLVALVSLVAMLVQTPYFEHLYVQAHMHGALYRDALTHADGDWPDNAVAHFDQGVYHVQGAESQTYVSYVAAPRRYDHALVEVSGRTGGGFRLGGVGLAISGPGSAPPLLTFRVTPEGSWWIERRPTMERYESETYFRIGDMSAIHQGFDVANQIAVLLNGADFTFYVNGQYVLATMTTHSRGARSVSIFLTPATAETLATSPSIPCSEQHPTLAGSEGTATQGSVDCVRAMGYEHATSVISRMD